MYGQTELGGRISQFNLSEHISEIDSVGIPLDGTNIHIDLDGHEDISSENRIGEIMVSSPSQLSNIDKNINGRNINGEYYISTGDLGYMKNKYLYVKGRNKGFIKIAGHRIDTIEIESRFKSIDGINEAVVTYTEEKFPALLIGLQVDFDSVFNKQIELKKEVFSFAENKKLLNEVIPKLPYYLYVLTGEIPKLSSGKINHQYLADKIYENHAKKGPLYIRI